MGSALIVVAVSIATFVIFGYLLFIWWLDRYEREPLWIVLLAFLWGAVGGTCLGCLLSAPFAFIAGLIPIAGAQEVISAVIVAPFAEEFTKALVFIPLVATFHFDNETDGLIYGAAAGLGFAAVENLLYYFSALEGGTGAVLTLVVMRTLFSALVHCTSSAILGMAIGYARHRSGPGRWLKWPLAGYLIAVANHALWNLSATFAGFTGTPDVLRGGLLLLGILLVIGASIVLFLLTQMSLKREHEVIRRYLHQEADKGTLPHEHADIIPFWRKRRKSGWAPQGVDKEEYIKAATLLAFRQHQMEIAEGDRLERYRNEIQGFRKQIRMMLGR
ncbi:PrsW family intramembrane metalloprotease [Persicimonas caeni]|uniref:PrsW family intramembrane metalloprotease n=1 Tax=Persicimonas caeni TaxID=2292766 RepID=A0A4Y6PY10_PERCE|nr:PrsW family intramembrane metalloprotease [Persicimonas caeni]QDG53228.1 PrsW family intramembrane metalloprotease [Persicimonas caeni]QED34450.1 PrsW family intramembrane metalloprotease [Persicimonas caeni]